MQVLLLIDPKTNAIKFVNEAGCVFFGLSYNKLITMNYQDLNLIKSKLEIHPIIFNHNELLLIMFRENETDKQIMMLSDIFYKTPSAITLLDVNERVTMINQAFTNLFGYGEEIIGQPLDDFIIPDNMLADIKINLATVFRGEVVNKETVRKSRDNVLINVHIIGAPLIVDNEIIGVYVLYEDISDRLRESLQLELFKEIFENNSDGIIILEENRTILHVNEAFNRITGYKIDELLSKIPNFLQSNVETKTIWQNPENYINFQGEIWLKTKIGKDSLNWLHLFVLYSGDKIKYYVYTLKSLTELDSMNKKLLLMMQMDPLTSLYNRVYFLEKVKFQKNSFLLFFDINRFKEINDTYGHNIGDEILIEFSKLLLTHFKDQLISRYGGDEFVIFIETSNRRSLTHLIKRLNQKLNDTPLINNEFIIKIATSIGIAQYNGETTSDLIKYADKAMYYAKQNNINYCFYEDIRE